MLIMCTIWGTLLRRQPVWGVLISLISVTTFCYTIYISNITNEITDWHTYNIIQWWLFGTLYGYTFLLSAGLAMLVARQWMRRLWCRHRVDAICTAFIIAFCMCTPLLYGAFVGRYDYRVEHLELKIKNLPEKFDGYKLTIFSDLHLGSLSGDTTKLSKAIDLINETNGDALLFLGDMVNSFPEETEGFEPLFRRINIPLRLGVLGNHDRPLSYHNWKWNSEEYDQLVHSIINRYLEFGITPLYNDWFLVERDDESILVGGITGDNLRWLSDTTSYNIGNRTKIVMYHGPEMIDQIISRCHPDLILCGHMHGGQIGLYLSPYKRWTMTKDHTIYSSGYYNVDGTHLMVNVGLGVIGLPMRIGVPPTITVITLRRDDADS